VEILYRAWFWLTRFSYKYLEDWASQEFLTVPQLTRVIVKRAIAQKKQNSQQKSA
jgi:hypothetical protein